MKQVIGLKILKEQVERELALMGYPASSWILQSAHGADSYDVAIVGGGMAGMTAAFALYKQGINRIKIFDAEAEGKEGPWLNYARMKILRSPKDLSGPALDVPSMTFQAWFEAQYGTEAWEQLYKIPTPQWMDYLKWYRQVLRLPIQNEEKLTLIRPGGSVFVLTFLKDGVLHDVVAKRVVLATGRGGFGDIEIPAYVKKLPKACYSHTNEPINFSEFKGKRLAVVGGGASGYDAAAVAVETGVKSVDILMRRSRQPNVNRVASFGYSGFREGFYQLSDEARWKFITRAFRDGSPPPKEALWRLEKQRNVQVLLDTKILDVQLQGAEIKVDTNKGTFYYDHLLLATGFGIDGSKQKELSLIFDKIMLWQDKLMSKDIEQDPKLARSPYLGASFEFMEKEEGGAPYLKHLYCFNFAASLSHGMLSSDIPDISVGADRLARGIVSSFFKENWYDYYKLLEKFNSMDFLEEEFSFINPGSTSNPKNEF